MVARPELKLAVSLSGCPRYKAVTFAGQTPVFDQHSAHLPR